MSLLKRVVMGLWIGLMVSGAGNVLSQTYPNKPIRIVSNEAGGGNDIAMRLITPGLTGSLGQPVIVENRPGLISAETVAKALPDGYTVLSAGSILWLRPFMQDNVRWDPVKDFSPITIVVTSPLILVVHPSLSAKSVQELIALAKARPGALNFSSGAPGTAVNLAAELFNAMAGVKIVGVIYKGTAPALTGLMGNEVQVSFPTVNGVAPLLKSGKLRPLAVTSPQPSALAPGLPTVAASGLPGYEAVSPIAVLAPAKTPTTVIGRLNQEIVRVINQTDVKEKLFNAGAEVVGNSPEQAADHIKAEMARLGKVIKDSGIREGAN